MLPDKYQTQRRKSEEEDDEDDNGGNVRGRSRNRFPSHQYTQHQQEQQQQQPWPPLGITGVLCQSQNLSIPNRGILHYTVFRPRNLQFIPPLVCVAGGPLLPCIYLQPIVHMITDRSIILYDALGCGQSKLQHRQQPQQQQSPKSNSPSVLANASSLQFETRSTPTAGTTKDLIPDMVQDFAYLIQHLGLPHFHLLGHSFGGIVAYEYLKNQVIDVGGDGASSCCLSLIMVSTPVSIAQSIQQSHVLQAELRQRHEDREDVDDETILTEYAKKHECRLDPIPLPLQQALVGVFSAASKGLASVQNYSASQATTANPHSSEDADQSSTACQSINNDGHDEETPSAMKSRFPPSLVLRGEYDFVSLACQEEWKHLLGTTNVRFATIPNSAHYAMLENEDAFASAVRTILKDPPTGVIILPNGVKVRPLKIVN